MHRRLHFCQHILGSVFGFVSEYSKLGFAPFAVGNVSGASVLAPANCFTMFDAFTASNTLANSKLLILSSPRHQERQRFSDGLFGRIAEEPLCALVPGYDDAIEALTYDRIITGLDNGSELSEPLLTFAQRSFHLDAFDKVRGLSGEHIK